MARDAMTTPSRRPATRLVRAIALLALLAAAAMSPATASASSGDVVLYRGEVVNDDDGNAALTAVLPEARSGPVVSVLELENGCATPGPGGLCPPPVATVTVILNEQTLINAATDSRTMPIALPPDAESHLVVTVGGLPGSGVRVSVHAITPPTGVGVYHKTLTVEEDGNAAAAAAFPAAGHGVCRVLVARERRPHLATLEVDVNGETVLHQDDPPGTPTVVALHDGPLEDDSRIVVTESGLPGSAAEVGIVTLRPSSGAPGCTFPG